MISRTSRKNKSRWKWSTFVARHHVSMWLIGNILSKVVSFCLQDYGKVPKYILQRRAIDQMFEEEYEKYVKEMQQDTNTQLSEEERKALLEVDEHTRLHGGSSVPACCFDYKGLETYMYYQDDLTEALTGFPLLLCCPGLKEELGWAAPRVPEPPPYHWHHESQSLQAVAGRSHEAAGAGHQPLWEVQNYRDSRWLGN